MIKGVLLVVVVFLILLAVVGAVYLWPLKVKAEWDPAPDTCIITVGYLGEIDHNYIPDAQVFGDGHVVWVRYDPTGNRQVFEGFLSQEDMSSLVDQLIDAGFFAGYRRFDWRNELFGDYLGVRLANAWRTRVIEPTLGYDNEQVLDLVNFLKSGAGCTGTEFVPTVGILYAYPMEEVDIPDDAKANYRWPDDRFGYGLRSIYMDEPEYEREITGEELAFAWEIVNSPFPLVESEGKVYWIAVIIPKIGCF